MSTTTSHEGCAHADVCYTEYYDSYGRVALVENPDKEGAWILSKHTVAVEE